MSVFQKDLQETGLYNSRPADNSYAEPSFDLEQSQRRYQDLARQNAWLKQQMNRNQGDAHTCFKCQHCPECQVREDSPPNNEIVMWSMLERNEYLENKIGRLRQQYEKQTRTLHSIRSSDKWRTRFQCTTEGSDCYEDKYLQILRVRSPFY